MKRNFTMEYWLDDGKYVGKLKEVPGVFSQGETLEELKANIDEVYQLMLEDEDETSFVDKMNMEIEVGV
ncbi:MAG: type II toxin-antitoxin system HicB family antitoxin [bacterium]